MNSVNVPILHRKENIVQSSECRFSSRPQDHLDREYTNTRNPVCVCIHSHIPDDEMILARRTGKPPSKILRTFIDHYIPAGVNFSTYLVSWLVGSKIFPIPFHHDGKGRFQCGRRDVKFRTFSSEVNKTYSGRRILGFTDLGITLLPLHLCTPIKYDVRVNHFGRLFESWNNDILIARIYSCISH